MSVTMIGLTSSELALDETPTPPLTLADPLLVCPHPARSKEQARIVIRRLFFIFHPLQKE
jgi:hypothetical protein